MLHVRADESVNSYNTAFDNISLPTTISNIVWGHAVPFRDADKSSRSEKEDCQIRKFG